MKRKHEQQLVLHLFLFTVMGIGLLMMFLYKGYPGIQQSIILGMAGFYVVWGLVFHHLKGDTHPKIVIEYVLIAILAVLLARGAIYS